jgi:CheY-like chemotaxis protein
LLVEVSDDGIGIEPDLLGRVFDEFEQGGSETTRRFGGLGLGLAICKALVEAHRGTIRADSRGVGHGATFSVELPARSAAAIAPRPPARRGGTSVVQVPGRRPLEILLVDDHRDTADVLATVLQGYGWRVATAYDARGALAAAAGARFDVVVSDIGLPDMSGHRLIRTLREQWRHSPFAAIALSGRGRDEDRAASLQAGFSAHLTKPVDIDRLAREIVTLTDPRNESKARQPEAD